MNRKIVNTILSFVLILGLMPTMAFAQPANDLQSKSLSQETRVSSASDPEPSLKDDLDSGTWGTCQWEWNEASKTIVVHPGEGFAGNPSAIGGSGQRAFENTPWYKRDLEDLPITNIAFVEEGGEKVKLPVDCASLFSVAGEGSVNIKSIDFSGVDTSQVENMHSLFYGCESIEDLDLSMFDTRKVTLMAGMFRECKSLKDLKINSFVTSQVTEMQQMFKECKALETLNLSHFDTSNVVEVWEIFQGCSSLKTLNISSFDTRKINDTPSKGNYVDMFTGCNKLESVSLGALIDKMTLLPSVEIKGHSDWYSTAANVWFSSQDIIDRRLGTADVYTKEENIKSITDAVITNIVDKTYTGSEIMQDPHITYGNYSLQEGKDYTLSYENNINPGTATVKITGMGKYEGTTLKTFTINPKNISSATVTGIVNKTYTGSAIEQSPKLTDGNYVLRKGTDYTLSYKNNINPGKATVIIKGMGKYTGSISKTFTITSAIKPSKPLIVTQPAKQTTITKGSSQPFSLTVKAKATKGGKLTYQWYAKGKALKGATESTYTLKDPSSLEVGNYALYCVVTETISGGSASTQSATSTLTVKAPFSFAQMTPKGKKALVISWSKEENADGYDVFFSRCNHGKTKEKCKRIKSITNKNTLSYTKTNLLANKTYKCYVRPYKMIGGKKVYLTTSPQAHVYTAGGNKIYSNPKSLALNKTQVSLTANSAFQLKAKIALTNSKKKIMATGHAPVVRYGSSDTSVAKVSKAGKIVGVAKGSCTIYAITQNGLQAACNVTVS